MYEEIVDDYDTLLIFEHVLEEEKVIEDKIKNGNVFDDKLSCNGEDLVFYKDEQIAQIRVLKV